LRADDRRISEDAFMRRILMIGILAAALVTASTALAASDRTLTGAAIGAGAGAIIAGPVGAVAGGADGAWVGGPRLGRRYKECWYDRNGHRHCRWR
jgi:osmotically inducible lipoprotein OsmB